MTAKTPALPLPLEERLVIAAQQAAGAKNFWQVYWFYKNERPLIADTMNEFEPFFRSDLQAHFYSFVAMTCAILEEGRTDTVGVRYLMRELKEKNRLSAATESAISGKFDSIAIVQPKMRILRNKVCAHRDDSKSFLDWVKEAEITFDQMALYGDVALDVANMLSKECGLPEEEANREPLRHLKRLFNALSGKQLFDGVDDLS